MLIRNGCWNCKKSPEHVKEAQKAKHEWGGEFILNDPSCQELHQSRPNLLILNGPPRVSRKYHIFQQILDFVAEQRRLVNINNVKFTESDHHQISDLRKEWTSNSPSWKRVAQRHRHQIFGLIVFPDFWSHLDHIPDQFACYFVRII
jgi:hypothetical protein